jgi:hypothetical protein
MNDISIQTCLLLPTVTYQLSLSSFFISSSAIALRGFSECYAIEVHAHWQEQPGICSCTQACLLELNRQFKIPHLVLFSTTCVAIFIVQVWGVLSG